MRRAYNAWQNRLNYFLFPAILLMLVAFVVRLHLLHRLEFDGLYGQDAFAYADYGEQVRRAMHDLKAPGPMYWPLGFPVLLVIGFSIAGSSPEVGQFIALICGAAVPALMYLFTLESLQLAGWSKHEARLGSIIAGLIFVFSGQLLQSSLVVMADAPALCWAVLSAWALAHYGRILQAAPRLRYRWIALAAFALAWAAITRWVYGILGLAWIVYCLLLWHGGLFRQHFWKDGVVAALVGGLIVVPQLLHSASNPAALVRHAWVQNWSLHNILKADFVNGDGTFHYPHANLTFYAQAAQDGWYLNLLLGALALIGGVWLLHRAWRGNRQISALLALLWLWYVGVLFFLAGIPYQNVRFSLAFIPPLALLTALGVLATRQFFASFERTAIARPLAIAAQGFILIAVLCAVVNPYWGAQAVLQRLVTTKNNDLSAVRSTEAVVEDDAVVYTLELWTMMRYYSPLETRQIFYEKPETIVQRLPQDRPTYVLINMWAINHQWVGQFPWQDIYTLQTSPGMDHLQRFGNYHLFRVKPRASDRDQWFINIGG